MRAILLLLTCIALNGCQRFPSDSINAVYYRYHSSTKGIVRGEIHRERFVAGGSGVHDPIFFMGETPSHLWDEVIQFINNTPRKTLAEGHGHSRLTVLHNGIKTSLKITEVEHIVWLSEIDDRLRESGAEHRIRKSKDQ